MNWTWQYMYVYMCLHCFMCCLQILHVYMPPIYICIVIYHACLCALSCSLHCVNIFSYLLWLYENLCMCSLICIAFLQHIYEGVEVWGLGLSIANWRIACWHPIYLFVSFLDCHLFLEPSMQSCFLHQFFAHYCICEQNKWHNKPKNTCCLKTCALLMWIP